MEDKNNLYIVGIVGIVAMIGIIVMVIAGNDRGTYVSDGQITDEYGQVIASSDVLPRTVTTTTSDYTPRIAYWSGKVNQHVNIATGRWETDPDGRSGATIDKLTYCKKWYPKTTSVVAYKMETIYGWRNAGNTGYFNSTKQSYKCVQPNNTNVTSCTDSDGINFANKGYVIYNSVKYDDYCISERGVGEVYCNGTKMQVLFKACDSDKYCPSYETGACIPIPKTKCFYLNSSYGTVGSDSFWVSIDTTKGFQFTILDFGIAQSTQMALFMVNSTSGESLEEWLGRGNGFALSGVRFNVENLTIDMVGVKTKICYT